MTAGHMSTSATVTELPLPPQRWILVGHDEGWRDAAKVYLTAVTHPMLVWRREAQLIVITTPDGFEAALQAAVDHRAPEVATFTQEGGAELTAKFRRVFPIEHPNILPRLYRPCTFGAMERVMQRPESHVIWRWLRSGRKRMPEVALDSAELRKEAGEAHEAWAEDYRRSWTEEELDEMFGNGEQSSAEDGDDEERPVMSWEDVGENVISMRGHGAPEPRGRPGFDNFAVRFAASTRGASGRRPAGNVHTGQVSRRDGSGPVVWELDFPPKQLDEGEAGMFTVSLNLSDDEWHGAGYLPPMLSIHAPDMLPVLVRTRPWSEWTAHAQGRRETKCEVRSDKAVIDALATRGGLVRMAYSRGEATDMP